MKKSILALCALMVAAGLSACGGGTSSYTVGGTVRGLQYEGLVLQNNKANNLPVKPLPRDANNNVPDVPYSFPSKVDYGDVYSVTVETQPEHQVCAVTSGGSDTAGRLATINATVICELARHKITGTIKNLAGDLTLINGSTGGTVKLTKNATTGVYPETFEFAAQVTYNTTYGVTITDQPANQECTVSNGTGIMKDEDVKVEIVCVTKPS